MQALKIPKVLLIAIVSTTGCAITAERLVFGPQENVKMEEFEGEYFLYDPWDKDLNEEIVASVRDGELEIVNVEECRQGEECSWKPVAIRLPASKSTNTGTGSISIA